MSHRPDLSAPPAFRSRPRLRGAAGLTAACLSAAALTLGLTHIPAGAAPVGVEENTQPLKQIVDPNLENLDNRLGRRAPSEAAKDLVRALGATRVEWNQFGTPASLIKHGGYLATGLSRDPVKAAKSFVRSNAALFGLTDTGLADLELVNDSVMSGGRGHAVLFRQTFDGLRAAQDGMITVGVVDGRVAYVSSSAAGDGAELPEPTLTATEAWRAAANSLGLTTTAEALSAEKQDDSWTTFQVEGLGEVQRSRLVAMPTPEDGVKPAFETIVYHPTGGNEFAYTVFVDAVTGEVLLRTNRLEHLAAAPMAPTAGEFSGSYTPEECGPQHPIDVDEDTESIFVFATAVNPANDIVVNILRDGEVVGGPGDSGTSPEVSAYDKVADDPAGTKYAVEVCPFDAGSQVAPPYAYAGSFVTSNVASSGLPFPPSWKYFLANPLLNGQNSDTRIVGCFTGADGQTRAQQRELPAGCEREEGNIAARLPWDVDPMTGQPTFTTTGNAARSVESWFSPLAPPVGDNYSPVSPDREYEFEWTDQWRDSKCSPEVFATPQRNDINASITSLFSNHNRMHDWSYFLGFTENNYNMQVSNFGNDADGQVPGLGDKDPELGGAQAGAVDGGFPSFQGRDNANQITLNDGVPGITNMYLWQPLPAAFYAPCVDGDFDQSVIGHEYTHAISNRMVGGPDAGLTSSSDGQARAMGESYSDLTAVEYLNEFDYVPVGDENPFAVGPYVTGSDERGIRNYGMNNSPLNFSNVRGYDGSGVGSPHDDGEIWSAVNFQIRQAMIRKYNAAFPAGNQRLQVRCANGILPADRCPGNRRWMQTVFDAYLLMPPAVTMLGSRDAYLAADLMRYGGKRPGPDNQKLLWDEFAKRGFGAKANSNGTDDSQPKPSFESPLSGNETTVTWRFVDENGNAVDNATVFLGDYEARVSPIADTDPSTPLSAVTKIVPGRYDFVVQAPGRGLTRLTRTFAPNRESRVQFLLLKNLASVHNGATVAGDGANFRNLIDDTEATNYVSGRPGGPLAGTTTAATPDLVRGRQITVDLAGNRPKVDVVKVSALLRSNAEGACMAPEECDPQDLSQNRFSALRQFAVEVCTAAAGNANCGNRSTFDGAGNGWERIFTSAQNAFPGDVPRPVAPQLIFREFDVPDRRATHVRLVVLDNQCTGNPQYHGDQDNDPAVNSDCRRQATDFPFDPEASDEAILAPQDDTVRAAEFQVFGAGGNGGGGSGTIEDPFVTFTKTGPATADQGETITYKLDYTNLGPAPSEQVKITDRLPAGVTFVSASGPDSYNSRTRTVVWDIGTVPVLSDGTVRLTVRVQPGVDTGDVLTNVAEFKAPLTIATPGVAATLVL